MSAKHPYYKASAADIYNTEIAVAISIMAGFSYVN